MTEIDDCKAAIDDEAFQDHLRGQVTARQLAKLYRSNDLLIAVHRAWLAGVEYGRPTMPTVAQPPPNFGDSCEQATVDYLGRAGVVVTLAQVRAWTIDQSAQAELWASWRLAASANEGVEAPLRPLFTYRPLDLWCVECYCMQFDSPGGACCENGHGGAEGSARR